MDSDVEKRIEQRRSAAKVFIRELKSCVDAQRFGHFLSCLHLGTEQTETVLKSIEHNLGEEIVVEAAADDDGWFDLIDEITDDVPDQSKVKNRHDLISERLMSHWLLGLDDTANSDQLAQFFLISKGSLDILQRELADGARRVGLGDKIAQQSRDTSLFPWQFDEILHHKSRLVTNIVNQFVNYLDMGQNGKAKDGSVAFERAQLGNDLEPSLPERPVHREKKYSLDWAKGFLEFVERNARAEDGAEDMNVDGNRKLEKLIKDLEGSDLSLIQI